MIGKTNALIGGGISVDSKPNISFDGKWSGWHVEFYEGLPYWEALFSSSGTLTNYGKACKCDAWGIGGGGAGGQYYYGGHNYGTGGGSGFTNMESNLTISGNSTMAITIGAGATGLKYLQSACYTGYTGGSTTFKTLSCTGGNGGSGTDRVGGSGGSNGGGGYGVSGGKNGSPGAGKIISKFWSTEHNNEYGAAGVGVSGTHYNAGGGGGYLDVGAPNSRSGHGYGGGGGGAANNSDDNADWYGKSGCIIIRIAVA